MLNIIKKIPLLLLCWLSVYIYLPHTNLMSITEHYSYYTVFILYVLFINIVLNVFHIFELTLTKYIEYEHIDTCIVILIGINNAIQMHVINYKLPICFYEICITQTHTNIIYIGAIMYYIFIYCKFQLQFLHYSIDKIHDNKILFNINNFMENKLKYIMNIKNKFDEI